jgi:hypothetical protein
MHPAHKILAMILALWLWMSWLCWLWMLARLGFWHPFIF